MPDPIRTSRPTDLSPLWQRAHPQGAYRPIRPVSRPPATPTASWLLISQATGVAIRITVCLSLFAGLLFFLFTYPAFLIGGFLGVVLLTHFVRAPHA